MKVIAYSLFGNNPRYTINMIINIELAVTLYPDWRVWVYYDNTVPQKILNKIKSYSNADLKDGNESMGIVSDTSSYSWRRLMWRFCSYDDEQVEYSIFRDADSYVSQREKDAVDQWISTKKSLHIMREVYPGHNSQIMAGMWGLRKNNKIDSLKTMCMNYTASSNYAMDQSFLNGIVYPIYYKDMVVHDSNSDLRYNDFTNDWPSPTYNDQYIGRTQGPPCEESGMVQRYNDLIVEMQ